MNKRDRNKIIRSWLNAYNHKRIKKDTFIKNIETIINDRFVYGAEWGFFIGVMITATISRILT